VNGFFVDHHRFDPTTCTVLGEKVGERLDRGCKHLYRKESLEGDEAKVLADKANAHNKAKALADKNNTAASTKRRSAAADLADPPEAPMGRLVHCNHANTRHEITNSIYTT
jgi:hypothetical protein